ALRLLVLPPLPGTLYVSGSPVLPVLVHAALSPEHLRPFQRAAGSPGNQSPTLPDALPISVSSQLPSDTCVMVSVWSVAAPFTVTSKAQPSPLQVLEPVPWLSYVTARPAVPVMLNIAFPPSHIRTWTSTDDASVRVLSLLAW